MVNTHFTLIFVVTSGLVTYWNALDEYWNALVVISKGLSLFIDEYS